MAWKILAQRISKSRQVTVYDFSMMTHNPKYEVTFWRDIESFGETFEFETESAAIAKFDQICKEYF